MNLAIFSPSAAAWRRSGPCWAIPWACLAAAPVALAQTSTSAPDHALAQAGPAAAETSAPAAVMLDEMVVSATREGTVLRQTPAAIHKIKAQTLAEKKPVFVGQVLNQTPGLYVTDLGNEQHNLSLRQPLSYNAVYLYLEEGLPIRPVGLFNHNALYELNLAGVGSIEVLKGPASSLYGSNAVGGAVNFLTQPPSARPEAWLGGQASDQGYLRVDYGASSSWAGQGLRLSGYRSARRGGWQNHNEADKDSLTLRHDLALQAQATLKTIFSYNRLWTDMPGSLTPNQYQNEPGLSPHTFTWRKVEAWRASSVLQGAWNDGGLSSLTLYARDNTTDQLPSYLIFNTGPSTAAGRITLQHFRSWGLDVRHRQEASVWPLRWVLGATLEHTPMQAQEVNLAVTRDPLSGAYLGYNPTTVRRDYAAQVHTQALYSQWEWQPQADWRWVLGGRYDQIRYGYQNHLSPSASTGAASESRHYRHFSPKLGGLWSLNRHWQVYGNWSQGFTPPEVSAQYGGSLSVPNLREAVFNNLDVGLRWASADRRHTLDLALYRLTGRDEIISYSLAPGLSEPRNAGRTLHQGLEFGWGWQGEGEAHWEGKLNGAWSRHSYASYQTSASQNFNGKLIPAAPRWLVNAELAYQPNAAWRLALESQWLGRYAMDDANTVFYPGHVLFNLSTRYRTGPWEAWLHLQNLTNKRYAEIAASSYKGSGSYNANTQDTYSPGAPRTVLLGLRYHYGRP